MLSLPLGHCAWSPTYTQSTQQLQARQQQHAVQQLSDDKIRCMAVVGLFSLLDMRHSAQTCIQSALQSLFCMAVSTALSRL
jgi:hypothetical protein